MTVSRHITRAPVILVALLASISPVASHPYSQPRHDPRNEAELVIRQGESLTERRDFDQALNLFQRALSLSRSLGDESMVSRCLARLSSIHVQRSQYKEALQFGEESLKSARLTGDQAREAAALTALGNACFYLSDSGRALECFQGSLQLLRQTGDRCGEANSLRDVGITYRTLGRYDESLESLNASLEIFRELDYGVEVASVINSIGACYAALGADGLAIDAYQQSLELARKHGFSDVILVNLDRLGYLYLDLGQLQEALESFREALALAETVGSPNQQSWTLMGLSSCLAATGQGDEALAASRRSLSLSRQTGSVSGIAANLRDIGGIYLNRDPALAARYYRQSMAASGGPLAWAPYHGLARAYRLLGEIDESIRYYEAAIDRIESVRGQIASDQHRATFLGKNQEVYRELIDLLVEQHGASPRAGYDARAFKVFEQTKARAMLDAILGMRAALTQELDPQLRDREHRLNLQIGELERRLGESSAPDDRNEIVNGLSQAESELDMLTAEIRRTNPRYPARSTAGLLTIEHAQSLLDERTALVAYLTTRHNVLAFVLSRDSLDVVRLAVSPPIVEAQVENLVDLIDRNTEGWQEISSSLYNEIVAPLRSHIRPGVDHLKIVPDGVLHYLPFEMLLQNENPSQVSAQESDYSPARFLVEDFTISYCPSATVLSELAAENLDQSGKGRGDIAVFADPLIDRDVQSKTNKPADWARALYAEDDLEIGPIPFSAEEGEAVGRYGGPGSLVCTGRAASEGRVKNERLDRFRIIHFATHGLVSRQHPLRSALLLASSPGEGEDGFLQAREIYQLKLKTELVVLSACRTGRGRALAGEGVEGLARAFFYAGARSIVATLWDVNDKPTTRFMEAFYHHLSAGDSKAGALREAKLEVLRDKATAAPRYWAAFILIGEADNSVDIRKDSWRGWQMAGVLAVLLITGAIVLVARRRTGRGMFQDISSGHH